MIVGFVGLGNMGSALAHNLATTGHDVHAFDLAGPSRLPDGAHFATSLAELAVIAPIVVLSLPDGKASEAVARQIASLPDRSVSHIIDTSTVGVVAAGAIAELLDDVGISYIDAPVSGGVAGARARTLTVMYAATADVCDAVEPVLAGLSDVRKRVGDRPGLAQAMKLANNFLAATALAATSEAIAFGRSVGLDMATMLEVLDASSGRNSATADKFPNHVLPGTYAAGFANSLMAKDVRLYIESVEARDGPLTVGRVIENVWSDFAAAEPGADFTRIFPFTENPGV